MSQTRFSDASGGLLVQSDPVNGTTAYLGDTELHVPAGGATVSGQRTCSMGGKAVAVRTGTSGHTATTLTWLDTDPHGTADLTEDLTEDPASGSTATRLFDPFGVQRGGASSWPDDRGFLHAPTDPFTSLTHLGARDYNPALQKFLSVDPVLDPADPQQNNGYSYAHNNPTTLTDPSGQRPEGNKGDTDAGCWGNQHCASTPSTGTPNTGGGSDDSFGDTTPDDGGTPGSSVPDYVDNVVQTKAADPHFNAAGYLAAHTIQLAIPDYEDNKLQ